jgi:hypothetical protein
VKFSIKKTQTSRKGAKPAKVRKEKIINGKTIRAKDDCLKDVELFCHRMNDGTDRKFCACFPRSASLSLLKRGGGVSATLREAFVLFI